MPTIADYAQEVWTRTPRTLATGTPAAPTNYSQQIAKAVWERSVRTLNGTPVTPVAATNSEPVTLGFPFSLGF